MTPRLKLHKVDLTVYDSEREHGTHTVCGRKVASIPRDRLVHIAKATTCRTCLLAIQADLRKEAAEVRRGLRCTDLFDRGMR